MFEDEHMFIYTHVYIYYIYIYICQSNAIGELVFFVNLVMRWNGHVSFFNSLNKMTNAAYENAMRRCPRN